MLSLPNELLFTISSESPSCYHSMLQTCKQIAMMHNENNMIVFVKNGNARCVHYKPIIPKFRPCVCTGGRWGRCMRNNEPTYSNPCIQPGHALHYYNYFHLPNGILHSIRDQPSYANIEYVDRSKCGLKVQTWHKQGILHRLYSPAVCMSVDNVFIQVWYENGKIHRKDGPAISINIDGEWYRPKSVMCLFGSLLRSSACETSVSKYIYDIIYEDLRGIDVFVEYGAPIKTVKHQRDKNSSIKGIHGMQALYFNDNAQCDNENLFVVAPLTECEHNKIKAEISALQTIPKAAYKYKTTHESNIPFHYTTYKSISEYRRDHSPIYDKSEEEELLSLKDNIYEDIVEEDYFDYNEINTQVRGFLMS